MDRIVQKSLATREIFSDAECDADSGPRHAEILIGGRGRQNPDKMGVL